MAASFGIVYSPWNQVRRAADLLERAAGEAGIDHVTIPAVTGPRSQLRPMDLPDSPLFRTEGGWHYPVDSKHYAGLSVRPRSADWCGSRDDLRQVCDLASRRGLKTCFRLHVAAAAAGTRHSEHLLRRNAWGEPVAGAACTSQPEIQQLLRLTMQELGRYGPAGFELDLEVNDGTDVDPRDRPPLRQDVADLLAMCFCAACRQAAAGSADAEAAARSVRVEIERLLTETSARPSSVPAAPSQALIERYRGAATAAHGRLAEQLAVDWADVRLFRTAPLRASGAAGRCRPLLRVGDGDLEDGALAAVRAATDRVGVRLFLEADPDSQRDPHRLVQLASQLAEAGVQHFDFEQIEQSAAASLTHLKQAVRYARRMSNDRTAG